VSAIERQMLCELFKFKNVPKPKLDCGSSFRSLWQLESDRHPVAGVDEVGRGALFGDVVAAAVILPTDRPDCFERLVNEGVKDSKQINPENRDRLDLLIREVAIDCQIGIASVAEIAELNILQASLLAMERAIAKLNPLPNYCLVDGNRKIAFKTIAPIEQTTVVGGDHKSLSIAAASIIAKVWRDRNVIKLAEQYPGYDLANNKGYATAKHRQAIKELGYSDQHRQGFKLKELAEVEAPAKSSNHRRKPRRKLGKQGGDRQLDLLH
jgi:ribonuclease HII